MLDIIKHWRSMPGNFKTVNLFDTIYTGITTSLVYGLGEAVNILDKFGANLNKKWKQGEKLKVLFLAYSGARNTGAEVRVAECIRQVNQVLGEENTEINMTTLDLKEAGEYFKDYRVNLHEFSSVFFGDIFKQVLNNHMIVLVEGSCWKENFATALLLYFLYGSGLAQMMDKPCFSYAVDAGQMNKLNNFISWLLSKNTKLITRSEEASHVLESIHLPGAIKRVDTAWSMPVESDRWVEDELRKLGWNGKQKLAGIAFQNYFWWPVVPDLVRYFKSLVTGDTTNQYKLVYFYDYDEQDKQEYEKFRDQCAKFMDWLADEKGMLPVIVAMEALDDKMCRDLISVMRNKAILISCNEYVGTQMGAILRKLHILTTTRYHAMVLSMPGCIPFIGLSRDERIRGVMKETGLFEKYYVEHKTPNLFEVLKEKSSLLLEAKEHARVRKIIGDNLPYYFAQMGMLGLDIRNFVTEQFSGIKIADIDENDVTKLVPYVPPQCIQASQKRFEMIRKNIE